MDPSLKMRLRNELLAVLASSEFDFCLTGTLVKDMEPWEADRSDVIGQLYELWREGKVRHPWGWHDGEIDWWALAEKKPTRGEKRRRLFAIIGGRRISDGTYDGGSF